MNVISFVKQITETFLTVDNNWLSSAFAQEFPKFEACFCGSHYNHTGFVVQNSLNANKVTFSLFKKSFMLPESAQNRQAF